MKKKNEVIRFFINLGAFLCVLILVDQLLGRLFFRLYFGQKVGPFHQITYAVDSAKQDIMVFGSSRAERHYSSTILSKNLGYKTYNFGVAGEKIVYSAALQEVAFKRHIPKILILDINPFDISVDPTKYEKLSILIPYYSHHPELLKYIKEIGDFEELKLYSKIYPFNSIFFILAGATLFPNKQDKDDFGYIAQSGNMSAKEANQFKQRLLERYTNLSTAASPTDEKAKGYLIQFLDLAKKNNIKTFVVISPMLFSESYKWNKELDQKVEIEKIIKRYPNVTYWDYSSDTYYNNHSEKFTDMLHLNKEGAEDFTNRLSMEILKALKK